MENREKMIGIRLTNREYEALTEITDALDISTSAYIRGLIRKQIMEV